MKIEAIGVVSTLAATAPPRHWAAARMCRSLPANLAGTPGQRSRQRVASCPQNRAAGNREAKRSAVARTLGAKMVVIVVAGALLGAFAAPIMAGAAEDQAPTTDPVDTLFRAADRDGNGAIDGREAGAAGAWLFAEIDENRDGGLSLSEMKTAPGRLTTGPTWTEGKRLATHLRDAGRRMDRDANGWISHREFHGFAAYLYWVADTDQSGTLTRTELDSFLQVYVENEPRLKPHDR